MRFCDMKKSLAELLSPSFDHYRSIGELAGTLQFLLSSSVAYRAKERWGWFGPTEQLNGYNGCVNCETTAWHSSRITAGTGKVTTWQQNHDSLYSCILGSLCDETAIACEWRAINKIALHMLLKLRMDYQHKDEEIEAWHGFMAMHRHRLAVRTLNRCHKHVNLLVEPQLVISRFGVWIKVSVTLSSEIKQSPLCYSRWDFGFLTRSESPKWKPAKETFAEFVNRSTDYYRNYSTPLSK